MVYTNYQSSVRKAEEEKEILETLRAEINNRQKETLKLLAYIKEKSTEDHYDPRWIYKTTVSFLDGDKDPTLTDYQPVLKFKEKNWATLLSDLEKVSGKETSDVSSLRTKYDSVKKRWTETPAHINEGKPTEDDTKKAVEAVDLVFEIISST